MSGSTTSREHRLAHVVPDAARTLPREAAPTPLFTRHMLGVIELERDERRRRRAAIRGGTNRCEPVAEPRLAAVLAHRPWQRWTSTAGSTREAVSVQGAIPMEEMKRCRS
jgi:hypothetical protein